MLLPTYGSCSSWLLLLLPAGRRALVLLLQGQLVTAAVLTRRSASLQPGVLRSRRSGPRSTTRSWQQLRTQG
jgi:hypothetical protein